METDKKERIEQISSIIKEKIAEAEKSNLYNEENAIIFKELWELSKEKYVLEIQSKKDFKKYKGLIFTVGFSAEPPILNILANDPECVFFINTSESEEMINRIVEETKLRPTQFKRERIRNDPINDPYGLVKYALYFMIEEKKIKPQEIALDLTAGTKLMSVGGSIAAAIFNIDILYVDHEKYNVKLRRPEHGSEKLIVIKNPLEIYKKEILGRDPMVRSIIELISKAAKAAPKKPQDIQNPQEEKKSPADKDSSSIYS